MQHVGNLLVEMMIIQSGVHFVIWIVVLQTMMRGRFGPMGLIFSEFAIPTMPRVSTMGYLEMLLQKVLCPPISLKNTSFAYGGAYKT